MTAQTYSPRRSAAVFPSRGKAVKSHKFRVIELLLIVIAVVISAGAYVLVGVGTQGKIPANVYEYTAWLAVLGLGLGAFMWWRARYADPVLVPVAVLLNGLGLAMIYRLDISQDTEVAASQLIWMTLGTVLAVLTLFMVPDHRRLRRLTYTCGVCAIALLLLPIVPGLGATINGARIWVRIGPMSFQPGEIAKVLLAIFFAGYLATYRDSLVTVGKRILGVQLPKAKHFGPIIIAWLASVGVLVFQRDLGTSLLLFGIFVAMLYVATAKKTWIFIGLSLFSIGAIIATQLFSHVQQRFNGWLHALTPEEFNKTPGGSYQLAQGLFGMASGGLTGQGLGEGRPSVVPFANSDFIYASLGEELGLVGLFAILMLYVILFERGMKIASKVRDSFGSLLCAGLTFSLALQCFIVIGGVTRLIPLTGLTTPFLAAGGSSLVTNWIIIAILARVSDNARRPEEEFHTGVLRVVAEDPREATIQNTTQSSTQAQSVAQSASGSAHTPAHRGETS